MSEGSMIFGLIGQAMRKIGAIGKDSTATNNSGKQMYKFRGIDAVYNALNPVMSELGLFICPEVLEQTREERRTSSGGALIYSILKVRFTMYAPDGSSVSCVVIGEGMDSGDKASNKAMSVALKYACFELFMIPTEEMIDPDGEVHDLAPKGAQKQGNTPANAPGKANTPPPAAGAAKTPENGQTGASVTTMPQVPPTQPPANPVLEYLAKEREALRVVRNITKAENNAIWKAQVAALQEAKLSPAKPLTDYTKQEAEYLISAMYANFTPTGTVLKNDGKAS